MLYYPDLAPYTGCQADTFLGWDPLAIGWLRRKRSFPTGKVPTRFVERLKRYCLPEYTVCSFPKAIPCALDRQMVDPLQIDGQVINLGSAEIRVMGDEEIFAAPMMIVHYVVDHHYRPPDAFITAVMNGPKPESAEFRALIRALRL